MFEMTENFPLTNLSVPQITHQNGQIIPQPQHQAPEWLQLIFKIGGAILIAIVLAKLIEYILNSFFSQEATPRIFVSHSFDHEKDYINLLKNFDRHEFEFYDHSINSDKADWSMKTRQIEKRITNHLLYVRCLLVLGGKYAEKPWIRKEVEIARKLGKKIIAVRPYGISRVPAYLEREADEVIGFHPRTIIEIIKNS